MLVRPKLPVEGSEATNNVPYDLLFRSPEQQYKFNHPYQCGTNYKLPHHAAEFSHNLQNNDIIVMGSDGLFDNLTNFMIA